MTRKVQAPLQFFHSFTNTAQALRPLWFVLGVGERSEHSNEQQEGAHQ